MYFLQLYINTDLNISHFYFFWLSYATTVLSTLRNSSPQLKKLYSAVNNCKASEILPYFQAKTLRLHSSMDAGRRYETSGSEMNSLLLTPIVIVRKSIALEKDIIFVLLDIGRHYLYLPRLSTVLNIISNIVQNKINKECLTHKTSKKVRRMESCLHTITSSNCASYCPLPLPFQLILKHKISVISQARRPGCL